MPRWGASAGPGCGDDQAIATHTTDAFQQQAQATGQALDHSAKTGLLPAVKLRTMQRKPMWAGGGCDPLGHLRAPAGSGGSSWGAEKGATLHHCCGAGPSVLEVE